MNDSGENTYIDGTRMQNWIPDLLNIKGIKSKPNLFDTERCVSIVDLGQGGFASELSRAVVQSTGGALAGGAGFTFNTTLDCRLSTNTRRVTGRFHSLYAEVVLDQAGALALNQRRMYIAISLAGESGLDSEVFRQRWTVSSAQSTHPVNPLHISWSGFVPSGFIARWLVTLQPDYLGAGPAVFPANSFFNFSDSFTIKPEGAQLPI